MSAQKLGFWLIPDVLKLITKISLHITRDLSAGGDDGGDGGHGDNALYLKALPLMIQDEQSPPRDRLVSTTSFWWVMACLPYT